MKVPNLKGLNYYWLHIAPGSSPQVVAVINGGKRGHPDARWGERLIPDRQLL